MSTAFQSMLHAMHALDRHDPAEHRDANMPWYRCKCCGWEGAQPKRLETKPCTTPHLMIVDVCPCCPDYQRVYRRAACDVCSQRPAVRTITAYGTDTEVCDRCGGTEE